MAAHLSDGGGQADEDGFADDEMADVEFTYFGHRRDRRDALISDAVACVDFETARGAILGGDANGFEFSCGAGFIALSHRFAKRASVNSTTGAPKLCAASIWRTSGSMKSETRTPASRSCRTNGAT